MAGQRWEQLGAATGIVFVVLAVVSFIIVGESPTPDDSAQTVIDHYIDDRDNLVLGSYLWGLAGIFYLWFLGSLRSHLRKVEGDTGRLSAVVFGAGIASGVVYSIAIAISSALAFSIAQSASAEVTHALWNMALQLLNFTAFGFFVFVAATSLISGRTKVFPAWLGWFGWLVALVILAGSLSVLVESGPFASGETVSIVGFFGFFLWFLAVSITVTRQVGRGSTVQR